MNVWAYHENSIDKTGLHVYCNDCMPVLDDLEVLHICLEGETCEGCGK